MKDLLIDAGKNAVIGCVVVLVGIGVLFCFKGTPAAGAHSLNHEMPTCDSEFVRDLLAQAVKQSPAGQAGLKLVRLGKIGTLLNMATKNGPDYQPGRIELMVCETKAFTNAGEKYLGFEMKWIDDTKKDEVWLNISVLR
jgi:hypothetical protein